MKIEKYEQLLFDGYQGRLHIILTIVEEVVILRLGRFDQEYSSELLGKFAFDRNTFYDVCDMFPEMSRRVRKLHQQTVGLEGLTVKKHTINEDGFIRIKGPKQFLVQIMGLGLKI